jgi:Flp pilus assembly protein TadG
MLGWIGDLRHDRRGAAAVELALVAPVLVTLMLVIFELGGAMQQTMRLESAARAGALHAAALPTDTGGIAATVRAALEGWNDVTVAPATVTCECPGAGVVSCGGTCTLPMERFVTVTVTRPFSGLLLTDRTTLTGHVVQRVQ